jgi:hypothetical protein
MATSVRLDDGLVQDAQVYATAEMRSVPKQIEHWAKIGRIAAAEIEAGKGETYVRRKRLRT